MKLFIRIILSIFFLANNFVAIGQMVGTPYLVNATPNPIITSLSVGSSTIISGASTSITPIFEQGTAALDNAIGSVASGTSYTISPLVTTTYNLTVTNSVGKTVSQSITVYVNSISLTSQPVGATVNTNNFNSMSVSATGTGVITYQWYDANGILNGYVSSTYRSNAAGNFYVIATSTLNGTTTSVTSNTATVTHNDISITSQPTNGMFGTGGAFEVSVTASGSGTLSYQWYRGSNAISGANSRTYSANVENAYYVEVTSTLDGVSNTLRSNGIYVTENKVTITSFGQNYYATSGYTTTLSPTYSYNGSATLSFQWYDASGPVNGATSSSLTTGTAGNYYVVITSQLNNTTGITTSSTATVTVVNSPSITSLAPDSYGIGLGSSTNLTPIFANGTGVITPGNILVTSGNSISISPTVNTTYTLTVTNQAGTVASMYTNVVITKGIFTGTGAPSTDRQFNFGFLLNTGKVLIANSGWSGNATAELYDYTTGTFSNTGSLNSGNRYEAAAVALSGNSKVLFTGGAYVGAAAEIYDASTGTFTNISNMRVSRKSHAATLLSDGRVFISGGYGGSNYLNSTEIYDPVTNTFSSRANMSSSRAFHSSILLNDGTVLIVGGYSSGYLNTAVIYNPSSNNYTATSNNMSDARGYPSLTLLNNGKVLIVGGANQRTGSLQPTYTAELYDPTTKTFSTLPSLPSWMYYHTATKQSDGLVLIAGGQATYGGVEIQTAILFDPTTNQFITGVTPMTTGRAWHSATLLPNGKTLFVGGYSGGSARTAEIYDPN
jgi:hypothetical protein